MKGNKTFNIDELESLVEKEEFVKTRFRYSLGMDIIIKTLKVLTFPPIFMAGGTYVVASMCGIKGEDLGVLVGVFGSLGMVGAIPIIGSFGLDEDAGKDRAELIRTLKRGFTIYASKNDRDLAYRVMDDTKQVDKVHEIGNYSTNLKSHFDGI